MRLHSVLDELKWAHDIIEFTDKLMSSKPCILNFKQQDVCLRRKV